MRGAVILAVTSLFFTLSRGNWLSSWVEDKAYNTLVRTLGFPTTDSCGFTRKDALICIEKYVDRNKDGEIDNDEFEYAKKHYMPKRVRTLQWALKKIGWNYTLKDIMPNCDANKDGHLTVDDWMSSAKTCLPGKADLCKFQHVCQIAAATITSTRQG